MVEIDSYGFSPHCFCRKQETFQTSVIWIKVDFVEMSLWKYYKIKGVLALGL